MELNFILEKVKKLNNYIDSHHQNRTENEKLLLKAAKLPEEVWELYNEILLSLNFSRDWKESFSKENLEIELADIILSTFVLWDTLWVDIESALIKKLDIVYNRFNLN